MNPPEQRSEPRDRVTRAPSVESLRERLLKLPGEDHEAGTKATESPATSPQQGSTFVYRFDERPTLVRDDFVLAAADPRDAAEREAARAERRRRRALRQAAARRRKRRNRLVATMAVLLALALAFTGWLHWTTGGLDRIPGALNAGTDTPGTTILLVGSDPSAHDEVAGSVTWKRDLTHSDLVMLVHLPEDGSSIYGISLPGRTQLDLPDSSRGLLGDTMRNGGQAAYVDTVERVTGLRVDHLAALNLAGLQDIIDELGGVNAQVTAGCGEEAGTRTLDGQGALELIRHRACLPKGDLDRVVRQQNVLKGVLAALVDGGALPNPFKLNAIAKDTFDHLAVDEGWGLLDMAGTAWSQREVTPRTTTFLTVPTARDKKRRLVIDEARAAELWEAVRVDRVAEYVALNREFVN